jgi:transposase-like protein
MARSRRRRQSYSTEKRTTILTAAQKEGLTAAEVQKRYGVTPVTYYSWRRKYGVGGRRNSGRGRAAGRGDSIERQVRTQIQSRVREIIPTIVRNEVSSYLDTLFRGRGRARRV